MARVITAAAETNLYLLILGVVWMLQRIGIRLLRLCTFFGSLLLVRLLLLLFPSWLFVRGAPSV